MEKDLEIKRKHSASHIMTAAVQMLYPNVQLGVGPWTDEGFYQDFDFGEVSVSEKELKEIEKKMRWIVNKDMPIKCEELSPERARELAVGDPYKTELTEELIAKGETITYYYIGESLESALSSQLCAGPHLESTGQLGAFSLTKIAGAYWRGSEKNKMLTRIYGVAFGTPEALAEYQERVEEAKKRDHRKLGKELDLFTFSETVGKGLPLWTSKGATIRREIERFIVDEEIRRGYQHVYTPDIAKLDLYRKSGHYPHYKDSMYAPIAIDDEEFMLRPMTCPHHFELYSSKPHSYKELPMRIAELAKLYRYEQSGELSGLVRVRSFCLADAHIICADEEQAVEEIGRALDLIEFVAQTFGLSMGKNYWYRLSLGDRTDEEKYYKDDAAWDKGEDLLRKLLQKRGAEFVEAENEAAFYGPKIDIQMRNVSGKEDTAFTVQYDFCMPERFNLTYTDNNGKEKRALVVHRSSVGALERIIAFLIEHYAGAFPTWLAPEQLRVLPVSETHVAYASEVVDALKHAGVRAELDDSNESLGKKVRAVKQDKLPYFVVIGEKEVADKTATLENRNGEKETLSVEALVAKITEEIRTRT